MPQVCAPRVREVPPTRVSAQAGRPRLGGDLDCVNFGSQSAAQAFYEASGPGDPHRLDGDHDGIACERR